MILPSAIKSIEFEENCPNQKEESLKSNGTLILCGWETAENLISTIKSNADVTPAQVQDAFNKNQELTDSKNIGAECASSTVVYSYLLSPMKECLRVVNSLYQIKDSLNKRATVLSVSSEDYGQRCFYPEPLRSGVMVNAEGLAPESLITCLNGGQSFR